MVRTALGTTILGLALFVCAAGIGSDEKTPPPDKPAATHPGFEKLKQLAGEWVEVAEPGGEKEAKGEKAGKEAKEEKGEKEAKMEAGQLTAIYKVTSAGSAVMETLFPGTPHEMVTMYHLDGPDLMLTHYCAAGNQPRMKLEKSDDPSKLVFKFSGGTNMDPTKDAHMHDLTITFIDNDHFRSEWTSYDDGKKSGVHTFEMKRKKA